jgi:ubiquinone/menaquinone biosynthesis C-methylase UbiE
MSGHEGWDDYAPFYDWENARTFGRRDVPFWRRIALNAGGPVLELGSGTGRVALPLARAGARMIGIDRSAPMLARARHEIRRQRLGPRLALVRGDIRRLPFPDRSLATVIAPYGILQSLLSDRALRETLRSVARVLVPGGTFGLELVADLPEWKEYSRRVSLRGQRPNGAPIALVESVRQDARRGLTFFDQEFVEGRGSAVTRRRFTLTFRTVTVPGMAARLARAGFEVTALLGDYRGKPWDSRADVWIILARRS